LGTASTGVVLLIFEIIELFLMPFHPVIGDLKQRRGACIRY
jgi:hypothetical protein